jgi:hypothetical protein
MPFLLSLLQLVSSATVYNEVIKLIITFIVNLDETISEQMSEFMSQFLLRIMIDIQETVRKNQFDNPVKLKLETYLNLVQ